MPPAAPREDAQDLPIHRAVHLHEPLVDVSASGTPTSEVHRLAVKPRQRKSRFTAPSTAKSLPPVPLPPKPQPAGRRLAVNPERGNPDSPRRPPRRTSRRCLCLRNANRRGTAGGQSASAEIPIHRAVHREQPPGGASASETPTSGAPAGGQSAARRSRFTAPSTAKTSRRCLCLRNRNGRGTGWWSSRSAKSRFTASSNPRRLR